MPLDIHTRSLSEHTHTHTTTTFLLDVVVKRWFVNLTEHMVFSYSEHHKKKWLVFKKLKHNKIHL